METLAAVLFLIGGSVWVGAIVFQSAVVAPAVFGNLDNSAARVFLRALFPRFFRFGLICGLLMIFSVAWLVMVTGWSDMLIQLAAMTGVMFVLEVVSLGMVASINAARDEGASGDSRFQRLHRASVLMTILIMVLGISVLVLFGRLAVAGLVA